MDGGHLVLNKAEALFLQILKTRLGNIKIALVYETGDILA